MKSVAFTETLQSLMADIQQKHMAMMQRHREELEDFMDEQLSRISQVTTLYLIYRSAESHKFIS